MLRGLRGRDRIFSWVSISSRGRSVGLGARSPRSTTVEIYSSGFFFSATVSAGGIAVPRPHSVAEKKRMTSSFSPWAAGAVVAAVDAAESWAWRNPPKPSHPAQRFVRGVLLASAAIAFLRLWMALVVVPSLSPDDRLQMTEDRATATAVIAVAVASEAALREAAAKAASETAKQPHGRSSPTGEAALREAAVANLAVGVHEADCAESESARLAWTTAAIAPLGVLDARLKTGAETMGSNLVDGAIYATDNRECGGDNDGGDGQRSSPTGGGGGGGTVSILDAGNSVGVAEAVAAVDDVAELPRASRDANRSSAHESGGDHALAAGSADALLANDNFTATLADPEPAASRRAASPVGLLRSLATAAATAAAENDIADFGAATLVENVAVDTGGGGGGESPHHSQTAAVPTTVAMATTATLPKAPRKRRKPLLKKIETHNECVGADGHAPETERSRAARYVALSALFAVAMNALKRRRSYPTAPALCLVAVTAWGFTLAAAIAARAHCPPVDEFATAPARVHILDALVVVVAVCREAVSAVARRRSATGDGTCDGAHVGPCDHAHGGGDNSGGGGDGPVVGRAATGNPKKTKKAKKSRVA
jgi:hypothetical protein